jgi:hypothetical protein
MPEHFPIKFKPMPEQNIISDLPTEEKIPVQENDKETEFSLFAYISSFFKSL